MNTYTTAGFVSAVFIIFKFVEMRLIDKESKPLKILIRDTLLVYFSVIAAFFFIEQLDSNLPEGSSSVGGTVAFTDTPGF